MERTPGGWKTSLRAQSPPAFGPIRSDPGITQYNSQLSPPPSHHVSFARHFLSPPNKLMRLSFFFSPPNPHPIILLKKRLSTLTNPNPKWLLLLSRQISAPSHLSQLLSLSIALGLFNSSRLQLLNSLLHSLSRSRSPNLALSLLNSIRKQSINPDNYTLTSALKAASAFSFLHKGRELHCLSVKIGLETDTFVLNSLISMYSVCGEIGWARKVFDSAPDWVLDVVSWNSMMSGYLKGGLYGEALWVFGEMVRRSVRMDGMTPVSALIACGRIGLLDLGRKIHSLVAVNGFDLDFYLGSSLVSMYAKCGDLESARNVFDGITEKNVVCWTSMISGYAKSGQFNDAVELFREMQLVGVKPDTATVACVVSCCGQLGALDQGRYLHAYCNAKGLGDDLMVKNAFIDMYSKCGDIERALQIFWRLIQRDVFSWTAMISGLAMNGRSHEALELFSQMEVLGQVVPNEVTFLGVLSACSHSGLVEEGFYYFGRMIEVYRLSPKIEHYGCIIDLLGRKKLLTEMERFIREMPIEPDVVIWRSLLFVCRAYGEVKLAEFAAKGMIELEPRKPGGHVLLSNVYAVASRWSDVNHIRKVMNEQSIHKEPGCSFIELNGSVQEFFSGDSSHPKTDDIHQALSEISRTMLSEPYPTCASGMFHLTHGEI